MIDQDKMLAIEQNLRDRHAYVFSITHPKYRDAALKIYEEAADAIDLLLAEVEAAKEQSKRWQALTEDSQKLAESAQRRADKLRTELEAAAADKRDALSFRDLMAAVVREIDHGEYDRPYLGTENAPGHAHAVPGIWDSDNGAKAGTQCAWCVTWNAAREALAQRQGEGS